MKLITENPYRIVGILSNATAREIQARKGKISAFAKVGKEITSDYDFPFFNPLQRTDVSIDKAFSDIEQNQNKVEHSLFWFINLNTIDNTALQHLISGNKEKAIEIWNKLTDDKEVTPKNFSAFNNIGTLYLLDESKEEIKKGIIVKIKLIESDCFKDFVHSVADETFTIDKHKQIEILIDNILSNFKNNYSTSEIIEFFSNCNEITQKYLSKKFTDEPIHKIETQIEICIRKREKDRINAYKYGKELYCNTKNELIFLESILGDSNLQFKMLSDKIAKEILQSSIDYFNESQNQNKSNNYLEEAMKLVKLAESIAVNDVIKSKLKDNISTLEEMKDRELSQVVNFLKTIKEKYEKNEKEIRQELKKMEETDIHIHMGQKTINRGAVEDIINNSINWKAVNDLLDEILSVNSLTKIKYSNKIELKKEFIELVNWLKEHSQKKSTIIAILEKYKRIPPNLPFQILSSEIINTNNKPLYTKFIRFISVILKVEVIENKLIELNIKYINPNGSLKHNVNISPKGYSHSQKVKLTEFTKEIKTLGWGKANICNFDIGKHRIEIYVDEYLIHSIEFIVEIAPSEKINKQLSEAKEKLKEYKQKLYLQDEINLAQTELIEIKKFQFFRWASEKQRQITNQQNKINELQKRAEIHKSNVIKNQEAKIEKLKSEFLNAKY